MTPYRLTKEQLLADLRQAYHDARRHKRRRRYQLRFEAMADVELRALRDELWDRSYRPRPSTCFIITDPKRREVFAAEFRDRIVHHLYYNYTHEMFERTFIQDSYSCIKGRGTHYGIRRLQGHIRRESRNYTEPCYVMKMDISGYFMSINRKTLLRICRLRLLRMSQHRVCKGNRETWQERVDMDFVLWLTEVIVSLNPVMGCRIKGTAKDWKDLPYNKSLFHSPPDSGLPIGNLTSQLFSNVYLGMLDDYMKRTLHCRGYGRYVDDFYVVSGDRGWLHSLVPLVRRFVKEELQLDLHDGKLRICNVRHGVEFLGAYLKPWRNYISNRTLSHMVPKIRDILQRPGKIRNRNALCSYMGVLSHYRSYNIFRQLGLVQLLPLLRVYRMPCI